MPKSRGSLSISQLRVGIFVLAALVILAFLILNSTGAFNPFEKRIHLKARFVSADGLHSAADVQLAGVSVGKVEEVRFLPPDTPSDERVEATMKIQQEFQGRPITEYIRTDSTAQLVATSVLGNEKMINITPGTIQGQPITENAVLESSTPVSINQLTATGNDLLKQIDKLAIPANEILNKANRGEGTLGRLVNDESLYRNLDTTVAETRDTMTRLQKTLDKVNSGKGSAGKLLNDPALYNSLNKTVNQLEAIATDIRAGRGSAGKFVSDDALYNETRAAVADLRVSAAKFSSIADDFKVISGDLAAGRGSAGKFLKDEELYENAKQTLARFNSTATKLEALITDVQSGKGSVGKLFTDETLFSNVNQAASNINQLSSEGTKLIYDFRQNPRKYLRVKVSIF
ncbi:MAG TPA: MlaD family protein [Pyrinomonadaceae bacterium]|nr:MlaD family protein [Pyrinomonadaceae bacterium]